MNTAPKGRTHLVERAVEAMGGMEARDPRPAASPQEASPIAPPLPQPAQPAARSQPPAPPAAPAVPPIPMDLLIKAGLVAGPTGPGRSRLSEEIAVTQHAVLRTVKAT
ncbi:MAG: hypothetical protein SNJ73_10150, partial [Acetobacteraceae bacterium]